MNGSLEDCPCKGCVADRTDSCHCRCAKYVQWKQERADMLDRFRYEKDATDRLAAYDAEKAYGLRRHKRR